MNEVCNEIKTAKTKAGKWLVIPFGDFKSEDKILFRYYESTTKERLPLCVQKKSIPREIVPHRLPN